MKTENTRPLAERLPGPGMSLTVTQSALKRQIEREAMETAHETGRTPRQLADERAELIASLGDLLASQIDPMGIKAANACKASAKLLTRLNS